MHYLDKLQAKVLFRQNKIKNGSGDIFKQRKYIAKSIHFMFNSKRYSIISLIDRRYTNAVKKINYRQFLLVFKLTIWTGESVTQFRMKGHIDVFTCTNSIRILFF
jgi:hypothetical protein